MIVLNRWFGPTLAAGSVIVASVMQAPLSAQTADQVETPPIEELANETPVLVNRAVMQGLDKITARVSKFEAPIGETVRFGSFEIVVRACQKTPPEEPPESTAFLEITDVRPDEPARVVFKGWMFASSPALSAVEHPVYDVWVTGCRVAQLEIEPAVTPETSSETQPLNNPQPAVQ